MFLILFLEMIVCLLWLICAAPGHAFFHHHTHSNSKEVVTPVSNTSSTIAGKSNNTAGNNSISISTGNSSISTGNSSTRTGNNSFAIGNVSITTSNSSSTASISSINAQNTSLTSINSSIPNANTSMAASISRITTSNSSTLNNSSTTTDNSSVTTPPKPGTLGNAGVCYCKAFFTVVSIDNKCKARWCVAKPELSQDELVCLESKPCRQSSGEMHFCSSKI